MATSDPFGGKFVEAVRRELQMTVWSYAQIERLIADDRTMLADHLQLAHPFLSASFLELVQHADHDTLARHFVDELRRYHRDKRDGDFDLDPGD